MSDHYYCVRCTDGRDYMVNETLEEVIKIVDYGSDHGVLTTRDGITILARHVVAYWEEGL